MVFNNSNLNSSTSVSRTTFHSISNQYSLKCNTSTNHVVHEIKLEVRIGIYLTLKKNSLQCKYRCGMTLVLFVIKCKAIKIVNLLKLASMRKWNADTFYILFISSLHLGNTLKRISMGNDG